ncbi:Phosphorelay intermediate protein YPD1 [Pichia kudriavzevii]|uniref:Phosphorelay intermediate protein YPD1 n=1 Tax=Pichia kudriavzevii TaxID=4909 RepID=A0A1V2LQZ0_PICKU|nr:Phosphorelay intermediate protein YPD1 [Pichia kudriavzevii]
MSVTQETLENSKLINWTIFQEILLMDEDEEGFAFSLIETFVEQAKDTFTKIEELLGDNNGDTEDNLRQLSQLGHYLKGSAAALGLQMVQNECERIQNYGKKESVAYEDDPLVANANTPQDWLRCCSYAFQQAKIYFEESRHWPDIGFKNTVDENKPHGKKTEPNGDITEIDVGNHVRL